MSRKYIIKIFYSIIKKSKKERLGAIKIKKGCNRQHIMDYNEICSYLESLGQFNEETGVERGRNLLNIIGQPEKSLKIIHIAGTNGKGSVCSYIESCLSKQGYKTGLFTSPHLNTIRERIQINRKLISEEDFTRDFNQVYKAVSTNNIKLAYFDFFFGIAMLYFKEQKVDYVVLETGLGGKLDATNAVERPICSVITAIGLEHTAILGDTLKKIAGEKAGIIKPGVPVVYTDNEAEVTSVIKNRADACASFSYGVNSQQYTIVKNLNGCIDFLIDNEYYSNDCFHLATPALYQVENAALAVTACAVIKSTYGITISDENIKDALATNIWQGRMEKVTDNIYVDGAHNPHGIRRFAETVNAMYADSDKKASLLFSVVSDKNFEEMINILCTCNVFDRIAVTVTGGKRQLDRQYIQEAFNRHSNINVEVYDSAADAVKALSNNHDMVFCTGSLYLVADIKAALKQ